MVELYSRQEIEKLKSSAEVIKVIFKELESYIKPGKSTKDIDKYVENIIYSMSATAPCKGYYGYPAATCVSVNEVVIHGIPSELVVKDGDIVSVDVVVGKDGFNSDASRTFAVGEISEEAKKLLDATKQAFFEGMKYAKVGNRIGDISAAIGGYIESCGFGIVRSFQGHGIGRQMHQEPSVPNYGKPNRGYKLKPGLVIAVEPMVTAGNYEVEILADKWTVVTKDGSLSAHYENTVVITTGEPEIITL